MKLFVAQHSIVRKIWGKSDTILFIFAGASAEFALNKAVDWLYFTGKLPTDPIGRLFSTVCYAQQIVFANADDANKAIDKITAIHSAVEKKRDSKIPDWAYRDVLYMLIYYSIAAFELLERNLNDDEKEEVFQVFYKVGSRMNLQMLPTNYKGWMLSHGEHLKNDLQKSNFTNDLFKQYKKHLGRMRFAFLLEAQKLVVPKFVKEMLGLKNISWLKSAPFFYKLCKKMKLDFIVKSILLPRQYKKQIDALELGE